MNKYQEYEKFKKLLKELDLPPVEYERRIKEWCIEHDF